MSPVEARRASIADLRNRFANKVLSGRLARGWKWTTWIAASCGLGINRFVTRPNVGGSHKLASRCHTPIFAEPVEARARSTAARSGFGLSGLVRPAMLGPIGSAARRANE